MSSLCRYKSLLCNCHASLRLTHPRSRKETFKSTLQNCAERPIGEYMREKYTPFLATNLTTLLTLFRQLSMKNVWWQASSYFNERRPHIAGTNKEWVHLGRSYERLSPLRQAIQTSSIAGLFWSHRTLLLAIATVTAHQVQLHCRMLLAEETQYVINLATQHISSVQNIVFISHAIRNNMIQMSIFINKVYTFSTNIKHEFRTLAIFWHSPKILRRSSQGNPSVGRFKRKRVTKYSDFDISKAISRNRCKIAGKLLLNTDRKSYMSFRLVPNWLPWITLNGKMALIVR